MNIEHPGKRRLRHRTSNEKTKINVGQRPSRQYSIINHRSCGWGVLNREQEVMIDCKYALELADGSVWVFAATAGVSGWLHELAGIMELRPTGKEGTHQICFSGAGDLETSNLPGTIRGERDGENGWRPYRNGGIYRIWRHETILTVHMELNVAFVTHPEIKYINMWSALREIHRHALGAGGTPMHAALAAHHGRGVLIAAPGETGKSTCYRRLPGDWQALCDDQALVLRAPDGGFRVHPFPTWSDHLWRDSENSWTVERAVPLSAIFFLEQASTDRAMPVGDPAEAVLSVLGAAKQVWEPYWERVSSDEKMKASSLLFHNTSEIAAAVPCFRLGAALEGEFWKEMEAVMDQMVTSPHSAGPLHRSYSALGGDKGNVPLSDSVQRNLNHLYG